MKTLLIAAVLAMLPVAAQAAVPTDTTPITDEEVYARAQVCIKLGTGELTAEQVVKALQLDTIRKQRDFALQCRMLQLGVQVGEGTKGNVT